MAPKSAPTTPSKVKSASAPRKAHKKEVTLTDPKTLYLVLYNTLSALGWSYCLFSLVKELTGPYGNGRELWHAYDKPGMLVNKASGAFDEFGQVVKWVQTMALLELVHSGLGLVRSGLGTTIAQVSSRIFMVWYICEWFPSVASSPVYASMVFAWSFTEIVRYSHYATGLLGIDIGILGWLRYSTFYLLYPMGAGSEAYLVYLSAAKAHAEYGVLAYYGTLVILAIWPPALGFMMTHMHAQRAKHSKSVKSSLAKNKKQLTKMEMEVEELVRNSTPGRATRSSKKAN